MNDRCWTVFAGLWPKAMDDWGKETIAEFNRRVRSLNLTDQAICAVLRQYRFEVRYRVPVVNDLFRRLQVAAMPTPKPSPGSSEFDHHQHTAGQIPWRRIAARRAADVRTMIENACTCRRGASAIHPPLAFPDGRQIAPDEVAELGLMCRTCGGSVSGKFWRQHFDPVDRDKRRARRGQDEERKKRRADAFGKILCGVEPAEGGSELRRVFAEHDRIVEAVRQGMDA